jgi:divalent metal cation (Fe/Co/Zn/Cd) transporter
MQNKSERATYPRGYRKKFAGIALFWVGIVCAIISMMMLGVGFYYLNSIEDSVAIYTEFIMLFVAFVAIVIGGILYFVGRSQAKKQKNQNTPLA